MAIILITTSADTRYKDASSLNYVNSWNSLKQVKFHSQMVLRIEWHLFRRKVWYWWVLLNVFPCPWFEVFESSFAKLPWCPKYPKAGQTSQSDSLKAFNNTSLYAKIEGNTLGWLLCTFHGILDDCYLIFSNCPNVPNIVKTYNCSFWWI